MYFRVSKPKSIDMCVVIGFHLGPLPWSLALPDGSLVRMNKYKLLYLLKEGVEPVLGNPSRVWIIDGTAVLQALQVWESKFGDLAFLIPLLG